MNESVEERRSHGSDKPVFDQPLAVLIGGDVLQRGMEFSTSVLSRAETLSSETPFAWESRSEVSTGAVLEVYSVHPGTLGGNSRLSAMASASDRVSLLANLPKMKRVVSRGSVSAGGVWSNRFAGVPTLLPLWFDSSRSS